jgi:hypothetical protein
MKPYCPRCERSAFTYSTILRAHPFREFSNPSRIDCPNCGLALRVSVASRTACLAIVLALLIIAVPAVAVLAQNLLQASGEHIIIPICFVTIVIYWLGIWPHVARFEAWAPFDINVPGERFAKISKYLWFPLLLLAVLAILAVQFRWWM